MTAPDSARDRAARAAHRVFREVSTGDAPSERDHKVQIIAWRAVVDAVAAELAKPDPVEAMASVDQIDLDSPTTWGFGARWRDATPDPAEAMAVLRELVANHFGTGDLDLNEQLMARARALVEGEAGR